jgi:translation initiation factor IF-2
VAVSKEPVVFEMKTPEPRRVERIITPRAAPVAPPAQPAVAAGPAVAGAPLSGPAVAAQPTVVGAPGTPPAVVDPAAPVKKEELPLGLTGRRIELPPRIQIEDRDKRQGLMTRREVQAQQRFGQRPGMGQRPGGGPSGPGQRPGMHGMAAKRGLPPGKKAKQTQITTPAQHKRVVRMEETIGVSDLAQKLGAKATEVLKKLWGMGMVGININSPIDQDAATLVAAEFGFEVESKAFREDDVFSEEPDKAEDLETRAPVITIMGHVDHGKTTLLDAIRDANVAAGEAGGITQHIGAYKVSTPSGDVVFLDTPGHEAFTAMRARGAQATDLVVLVVAADDGVMPQTIEALAHARDAKVPIIVAVNKIDKPGANPEVVMRQLSQHGLNPEMWGGDTMFVPLSALKRTGVDTLLENLALQAEVLELRANPKKPAKGMVVEARLDRNRGAMATVLIQDGTLRVGDLLVVGEVNGKVRAMLDDKGRQLSEAGPSTPVEVLGLDGVPEAGDTLRAVTDEKAAKALVEHRKEQRKAKSPGTASPRVSLENLLERIQDAEVKELKVVLKADVQGSAGALRDALAKLSTVEVRVNVIQVGVGGITETDVNLAKAGGAVIIGFHVRPAGKAAQLAEQEGVDIKLYDIIYEALDDVRKGMAGMLAPVEREKALGRAEVRQTFAVTKSGMIAGCAVLEGKISRQAQIRLVRESVEIWTGKLSSLRRFKDDVREVEKGYECGVSLEGYADLKVGDVIEAFEIEQVAQQLS